MKTKNSSLKSQNENLDSQLKSLKFSKAQDLKSVDELKRLVAQLQQR